MSCNVDPSEQLHNSGGICRLCSKDGAGWEGKSALKEVENNSVFPDGSEWSCQWSGPA